MTTPKPPLPAPTIAGVKFREPVSLDGVTPLTDIDPTKGYDVAIHGGSVFIVSNRTARIIEVPRSACVIRWNTDGMTSEAAMAALTKGGQFHYAKAEVKKPRAKPEMLRLASEDDEDELRAGA